MGRPRFGSAHRARHRRTLFEGWRTAVDRGDLLMVRVSRRMIDNLAAGIEPGPDQVSRIENYLRRVSGPEV